MNQNKIKKALKIYPVYEAMGQDLLFYSVIEILFLTLVKGYTDSQVALIFLYTDAADLLLEYPSYKIIKRIGNSTSVIVGAVLPLLAILSITFSPNLIFVILGNVLFVSSGNFRSMGCAGARNNLSLIGKTSEFAKFFSKGNIIYAAITMLSTALIPGLFYFNRYYPSYLCIIAYTAGLIAAFMMPDYSERLAGKASGKRDKEEQDKIKEKKSIQGAKLSSMMKYLLFVFCIFFCSAITFCKNSELLLSDSLNEIVSEERTILYFGIFIFVSRLLKLIVNTFLPKILNALKEKMILVGSVVLFFSSIMTAVAGIYLKNSISGIVIIAFSYFLLAIIWDPMRTFLRMLAVDTNSKKKQQKMLVLLNVGQSVINVFLRLIVYVILRFLPLSYVFPVFALLMMIEIIMALRLVIKCRESLELMNIETVLTEEELDNIAMSVYELLLETGLDSKQAFSYRFLVEEKLLDQMENGHKDENVRIGMYAKNDEISIKLTVGGEEINVFAVSKSDDAVSTTIFGNLLNGLDK